MQKTITAALIAAALFTSSSIAAWAGPQYQDETDFAVSGYDVVAYFDMEQVDLGEKQASAVPGKTSITAEHNGALFAFANTKNRDRFLANPEKFAPQYDGHCAFGARMGFKVPANPNLWRIVDGKLYLNIRPKVVTMWEKDIAGNIKQANENWHELEAKAASGDAVPEFDTTAAPVRQFSFVGGEYRFSGSSKPEAKSLTPVSGS